MRLLLHLVVVCLVASCAGSPKQTAPSLPATTPTPTPVPVELSLKQVVDAFDKAGLPIKDRIVYDERTDPNGLLGRPNRYVEKMNFNDARDKKNRRSLDSSIEVFKNPEDAEDRKKYLDAVGKASSIFASYSFLHRNVLVRISFGVVPSEAEAYKNILESINP